MIDKSDCFLFRLQAQKVEMNNDEKLMPKMESEENVNENIKMGLVEWYVVITHRNRCTNKSLTVFL